MSSMLNDDPYFLVLIPKEGLKPVYRGEVTNLMKHDEKYLKNLY